MKCKNCKSYKDDCGYHFIDSDGHIDYEIPKESSCDKYGVCVNYEEKRNKYQIALENIKEYGYIIGSIVNLNVLDEVLCYMIKEYEKIT